MSSFESPAFRCLLELAPVLDGAGYRWAVGGAVGMALQGLARPTSDLDIFAADSDRGVLQALRDRGFAPGMYSSQHARALVPGHPDGAHLDVVFTRSEPLSSAVVRARPAQVEGMTLPVWPLEHIVAAKLLVDPAVDPQRARKDRADLDELWMQGMIDRTRVEAVLDDVGDEGARERLYEVIKGT